MRKLTFLQHKSKNGMKGKRCSIYALKSLSFLFAVLMSMTVFLYTGAFAQAAKADIPITLSCTPTVIKYGDYIVMKISWPSSSATGNIYAYLDGAIVYYNDAGVGTTLTLGTSLLTAGEHIFEAKYAGDDNYNACNPQLKFTVYNELITLAVTSDKSLSTYGETVAFTAALSNTAATGVVCFYDGNTVIGSAPIISGTATFQTSSLTAGSHVITAIYAGDMNYNPCKYYCNQMVEKPCINLDTSLYAGGTYGDLVYMSAMWSSGSATGLVNVYVDGIVVDSGPATGYSFERAYYDLIAGYHYFVVYYDGDPNYGQSWHYYRFIIYEADSTLELTSNKNPSTYGDMVTFTAKMSKTVATGIVYFYDGETEIGSAEISNGIATFQTSTLTVGSHTITAKYEDDTNFNPCENQMTQTVDKADIGLSLISSKNPSAYDDTFIIKASWSPGSATGMVGILQNGVVKAVVPISDGGKTLSLANLDVGSYDFEATYAGDANYYAAYVHVNQTVNKADVTLSLLSNNNPSQYGNPVTFNASLSKVGATGTVSFFEGTKLLGNAVVVDGKASLTTTDTLSLGDHDIRAEYSGDAHYNAASNQITQTVIKRKINLTLSSNNNPSKYGETVTWTAALTSLKANGTNVAPTGTVDFYDGTTRLGVATITGGAAWYTTSALSAGDHEITANYSGDVNYNGASASVWQTVDPVYTVHYVDLFTDKSIVGDKIGSGTMGEKIDENAVPVNGYVVTGSQTQSITLNQNTSSITFRYIPIGAILLSVIIIILLIVMLL